MTNRERTARSDNRWRWTAIILAVVVSGLGCNPGTMLNFMALQFSEDKLPPACELKTSKKEVTVVMNTFFAKVQVRPELLGADSDLNKRIARHLQLRYQANRDAIKIIADAPSKQFGQPGNALFTSSKEKGKESDADYVINLEINSLSLKKEKSWDQFFEGNVDIHISVTKTEDGDLPIWEKDYRLSYPETGPIYATDITPAKFKTDFFEHIAKEISRFFARYPRGERMDMYDH